MSNTRKSYDQMTMAELIADIELGRVEAERRAIPLTREDLDTMSPEEIVTAKRQGRLDALLGRTSD